jgi:glycosyltransferase involved in cell wall biosynthesis
LAYTIADAFKDDPYDITTAFFHTSKAHQGNTHFKDFNFQKSGTSGLRLKASWTVLKYCRKERFDVVITHRFKPLYMMLLINLYLKIPLCISVIHGFGDFKRPSRQFMLNRLWNNKWHFVGVSESVSNYLKRTLDRLHSNIHTINNCTDVNSLTNSLQSKQQSRELLGLKQDAFVFGTIGRLVPLKGHINLIKAFEIIIKKRPECQLIIIGEGRERQNLENYIADKNLKDHVILAGHIEAASTRLKAFDVFVLPSLNEGFGLVLLEAMVAKLPVIASNTGGVPHVLGKLGSLVSPIDNRQAIASAMLEHLEMTSDEREVIGQQLNKRLIEKFNISAFQEAYRTLVSSNIK